jgi:hypothetical protein
MTTGTTVRMILVNCTGLLGDILKQAILDRSDMTVVSELANASRLAEMVRQEHPDVVIWNDADEDELTSSADYFCPTPPTKVLATLGDGRDAAIWQLKPQRTPLGQLSPGSLVEAILQTAAR